MQIRFTLQLPRDALSIPVARRVFDASMRTLGVAEECVADVEVALTEACTNVLDHAEVGDEYEVVAGLDENTCVIEVVDRGHGFDHAGHGHTDADLTAEQGRGIQLISALVDRVHFCSRDDDGGTVVRLEKSLEFTPGLPLRRLADRGEDTTVLDLTAAERSIAEREAALLAEAAPDG